MKTLGFYLPLFILLLSCSPKLPKTMGDPQDAETYGYQPLDPLPVKLAVDTGSITNARIMNSLPDETMRLAIGEVDFKGDISYGPAKMGYKGSSYIVILDYIKFDTKSLEVEFARDTTGRIIDFRRAIRDPMAMSFNPEGVIPVYVGVGLRFTATIHVNEGSVDLGNLFALGVAAEAKKITGTLIIQTLGISGEPISGLIPMPSQINTTTIQNAIMALAAIKSKIYEGGAKIEPRVVGFYNNVGGGQATVNKFISSVLTTIIPHYVR